ncbi:MAG: hypothetical protein AAGG01_18775, partial [Planctomycetota bacterium]
MNQLKSGGGRMHLSTLGGFAVLAIGAATFGASVLIPTALGGSKESLEGSEASAQAGDAEAALEAAFGAAGVFVDRASGAVAFPVTTEVRAELLEYVLVNPHGAIHESLFVTGVDASVLGTAFLAVGVEKGKNVEYVARDPPPTPAEARAGAPTHDTIPPSGKPLYLHVAWRERAGVPDAAGAFPE